MLNKVMIIGRLGQDPEVKTTETTTISSMSVATSKTWVKDGEKQERTEWHRCIAFGKTAELIGKYLSKGRQVYVEGSLQTRSWETDAGEKRYTTEIVVNTVQFFGDRGEASEAPKKQSSSHGLPNYAPQFDASEDVPF